MVQGKEDGSWSIDPEGDACLGAGKWQGSGEEREVV